MRRPDILAPFTAALGRIDARVERALDVGTGTGAGAEAITERYPDAEVIGVDVSPAMLEVARKNIEGVSFREADAAKLPFGDGEFDLVAHSNMIPFLD